LGELLHEEDLRQWRRTHYSTEIAHSRGDAEVVVMGWVASVRDHGNIQFMIFMEKFRLRLKRESVANRFSRWPRRSRSIAPLVYEVM
jgi:hypothetical protein